MIDFGNLLDEFYQESSKEKKSDKKEKYDDKYDLDNGPDTSVEPVDVDVDDDFDNDTTDKEDEEDDDKKNDKDKDDDKKKGDKKKKSPLEEDNDGEIEDVEEFSIQEASIIKKRHENQDVDVDNESRVNENNYYTQIARNSKDLEHLYKTLLKRADKETIIGELTNLFNELKEMREKYFKSHYELNKSLDPHKSYHGMQKIIEQDMNAIQQNIDKMSDPKEPKLSKTLVKKTIKMMNNLQQDMITECQRSQPFEVRHAKDIAKKMWLFESYTEDDYDESEYVQEEVSAKAHLNARQQCIKDLHKACDDATSPINTKKMKYNLSDKDISTIRDGADDMREAFDNFIKNSKGTSMEFDLVTDHLRAKIERFNRTIDKNLENAKNKGSLSRMGRDQLYNALTGMRDAYSKLMFENLPTAERVAVMATDMFLVKDAKKHMSGIFKESVEDDMFAKIGEMMVHYRKQKELQDLAEKNGVQINGVRYTDDSIMNIVTSVVALMMARNEGDPRYRQLVEQGMRKRSLKVEIINSYKDKANELINQYDHGPIVGAAPAGNTIEIVSDEDVPVEEFYIDENGEMQSTYYQEADEDDSDDNEKDEEIDDDDDADDEDDLDESDSEEEDAKDDDDEETDDEDDDEEEEEEEDIEEFYIDENGEMQSSWYNESETTETITKPARQRNDEEQSWGFRPGRKIGPIEFGMTREKVRTAVSSRYGEPKPQSDTKDFSSAETYGNKFSVYYDASQKVCAVEINNNIVVEMDRSIIFPGDPTNIKKKALDLQPDKANPERGLTSRIMGISIILDPSNKIKSILFIRKGLLQEKEFKKFGKVSEMMNGDDETSAIRKMKEIYKFLDKHHVISDKGKAAMKHIDKDTVLTSNELTMRGCEFMVKYYDQVRGSDYKTIRNELEEEWNQFNQSN